MIGGLELGKRSQLSRGGRSVGALIFIVLSVVILNVEVNPPWAAWMLLALCLLGLLVVCFWKSEHKEELNEEDAFEVARQAVRSESDRLEKKRRELERVLMAYGEWMEFPDYDNSGPSSGTTRSTSQRTSVSPRF